MSDTLTPGFSELTFRSIMLGVAITVVFTAAQVYLGLKVGMTFATSIPAAVISMALLRIFSTATIQENNIVQTIASAAGALASVIFVLPGLLMIGWWSSVPFLPTFGACAAGGVLGVMYTIPLRRALVTQSTLAYPEGVAAAEVLKVGVQSRGGAAEGTAGFAAIGLASAASAGFAALAAAKVIAAKVAGYSKVGAGATGLGASSSLALIGAGHLMGVTGGVAILTGLGIAWGILVPTLTALHPVAGASIESHVLAVWRSDVRFVGAGVIGAAAICTLAELAIPIWKGLASVIEAGRGRARSDAALLRVDQDIPIGIVGLISLATLVPTGWLLAHFLSGGPLSNLASIFLIIAIGQVLVTGFLAAAICGYMAGLVGSSNSPVSGVAILAVLGSALMIGAAGRGLIGPDATKALVAYTLYVTAIVLAVAVVANDNLQDLKTGQLVGATPWKQQVALIIGVLAGSVIIPLILNLLNQSNGFSGAANLSAMAGTKPLDAPQATLISTLASGVMGGTLHWSLLGVGALIGLGLVMINIILRAASAGRLSLPPLGVGLAIYLPNTVTVPVAAGALLGWVYNRTVANDRQAAVAQRLGILIASGFIVGESLLNVSLAALIVVSGNATPLAIASEISPGLSMFLAVAIASGTIAVVYGWARRAADRFA